MSSSSDTSLFPAMLVVMCCSALSACVRINPAFDGRVEDGGSESSAELETSGAELETSGAEQSESEDETETGPPPDLCGDGVLGLDEECDDGNGANDDGCTVSCVIPSSCAEILAIDPASPSGTYLVDPMGSGAPWPAACDMVIAGGGWTGFAVQDTCTGRLPSELEAIWEPEIAGIDDDCRPYAEYLEGGALGYTWDIEFPPGFEAFFLRDYQVKGLGSPEFFFTQEVWELPAVFPNGALSFGNAYDEGPITTWTLEGGASASFFDDEIRHYPTLDEPFELGQSSDTLRIGWGERGQMREGLYPWWSGRIFVR